MKVEDHEFGEGYARSSQSLWLQSAMHDLIREQAITDPTTGHKGNAILGFHKYLIIGEGGTIFHKPRQLVRFVLSVMFMLLVMLHFG